MKSLIAILLLLSTLSAYPQALPNFEIIKELPDNLSQYIPEGFAAMDTLSGNLNRDQYRDFLMVLKEIDEDTLTSRIPVRPLLIFIGQADGSLQFAARNDDVIECISCGGMMGDPYQGLVIKNGFFSAEHFGGASTRWIYIITYKYSTPDNNWLLHKLSYEYFRVDDPDKIETEIKTEKDFGRILFSESDIETED